MNSAAKQSPRQTVNSAAKQSPILTAYSRLTPLPSGAASAGDTKVLLPEVHVNEGFEGSPEPSVGARQQTLLANISAMQNLKDWASHKHSAHDLEDKLHWWDNNAASPLAGKFQSELQVLAHVSP